MRLYLWVMRLYPLVLLLLGLLFFFANCTSEPPAPPQHEPVNHSPNDFYAWVCHDPGVKCIAACTAEVDK